MGKKPPTGSDVAALAGVSLATVSHVFHGRKGARVPDLTRERVLVAAHQIGYRPNKLARGLARGASRMIGMAARLDTFDGRIAAPLRDELNRLGYLTILSRSREHYEFDEDEIDLLLEHRVDALIAICGGWGMYERRPWVETVVDEHIPCVMVNDADMSNRIDCVVSDNRGGARAIVEHLIERGHTRIGAYSLPNSTLFTEFERHQACVETLRQHGLAPLMPPTYSGESVAKVYQSAYRWLSQPDRPTAIAVWSDPIVAGIFQAAVDLGLRIPQDLALVGFGNEREAILLRMTTIDQHPDEMAHETVKLLIQRIEEPEKAVQRISVRTNIIIRNTT